LVFGCFAASIHQYFDIKKLQTYHRSQDLINTCIRVTLLLIFRPNLASHAIVNFCCSRLISKTRDLLFAGLFAGHCMEANAFNYRNRIFLAGLWSRSRKDFQPEESKSQKILTTPTPGRLFAHQLWLFVPQTCVSVTLGNLSSLTFQQEMIVAIQKGCSVPTCISTLRGHSRSAASLGLIMQPTPSQCNRSGLVSLKFPFAHSGWHYRCCVTLVTQQWIGSSHGNSSIVT